MPKQKVRSKLRVGTRKSGKSANLMTTDELNEALSNTNSKRYKSKILKVLTSRSKSE